jgi:hypothetical protein
MLRSIRTANIPGRTCTVGALANLASAAILNVTDLTVALEAVMYTCGGSLSHGLALQGIGLLVGFDRYTTACTKDSRCWKIGSELWCSRCVATGVMSPPCFVV